MTPPVRLLVILLLWLGLSQAHFDAVPGRGTTVTLEVPLRALA